MTLEEERLGAVIEKSATLCQVLEEASLQNRLVIGIYNCGKLLEIDPSIVMFCVLSHDAASDITLNIHLTLIEAFCLENRIAVIKVDDPSKLEELLPGKKDELPDSDNYTCLIIKYPESMLSETEQHLIDLYVAASNDQSQLLINLDV